MAFILYAAGSATKESTDLKRKINYDQLLSQLNEKKSLMEWVEYKRTHPECTSKILVDSGAYTAHTKGKEIDVDAYIQLINDIDDQVDAFAQVDKIPGRWGQPKTPEQLAEAPELSWENYLYMVDKIKSPKKLLPIFHQGEDFKHLKRMLEYKYTFGDVKGEPIDYIGISCNKELNPTAWVEWFKDVFKMIRDSSNPNIKTHAFGMTSLNILEQFPFYSADSTSWIRSASFGNIVVNGCKSIYCSSLYPNDPGHIKHLNPAMKESISKIAERYGYSFFEIADESLKSERVVLLSRIDEAVTKYCNNCKINKLIYQTDGVYLTDIKENILNQAKDILRVDSTTLENYKILESDLGEINGPGKIRALFNLCSLREWAIAYEYRGTNEFKEDLW